MGNKKRGVKGELLKEGTEEERKGRKVGNMYTEETS